MRCPKCQFEKFIKVYNKSDIIFEEGSFGNEMFIIRTGKIRIYTIKEGQEIVIRTCEKGEIFGEMALVDDTPRVATAIAEKNNTQLIVVDHSKLYLIPSTGVGSHVYLIKGTVKNVLIDTGLPANFRYLKESLSDVGLKPDDIDLIILSHEHWDHIGAASFFIETSIIAAHYLAANKIMIGDEFVLMNKYFDQPSKSFCPDIWLYENTVIDLGNYKLNIVHTPGHCSGCICLHEPEKEILFTGDTIMAGGVLSGIYTSGSIADYIDSLNRLKALKVKKIYPGHGKTSNTPRQDLNKAIERSSLLMNETRILFDTLDTKQTYKRLLSSARNYSNPKRRLDHKDE